MGYKKKERKLLQTVEKFLLLQKLYQSGQMTDEILDAILGPKVDTDVAAKVIVSETNVMEQSQENILDVDSEIMDDEAEVDDHTKETMKTKDTSDVLYTLDTTDTMNDLKTEESDDMIPGQLSLELNNVSKSVDDDKSDVPDVSVEKVSETDIELKKDQSVRKQRVKVDRGKVLALHKAGWSAQEIAIDVKCAPVTVWKIIHEAKEDGKLGE